MKTLLTLLALLTVSLPVQIEAQNTKPDAGKAPDYKNVTVAEAAKLVSDKKVVVLDIRTADEFKEGHIAGARNIDFLDGDFEKALAALDKNQSYLVHCASGGRSGKSMEAFKRLKFQSILHMNSGFKGWTKEGKPVEK